MRIFISGVAGFLGRELAKALIKDGHEVVGNDNFIGSEVDDIPSGIEFHKIDCNNIGALKILMKNVDIVYHLACTPHEGLSVVSPYENTYNGYAASAAMISAAITNGIKRIVFTSSMARYGKGVPDKDGKFIPFTEDMITAPVDPYAIGKVASEDLLKLMSKVYGIEHVIAVPHNIIGKQKYDDPFRNVAAIMCNLMLMGRQPIIYGDGQQKRCFSFVDDVVEPLIQMGMADNCNGEIINIGPDDNFITINELSKIIADLIGFDLHPIYVPDRPQEVKHATCSANKARKLLGYDPKVQLKDGLKQMIEWIKIKGTKQFKYHLDLEIISELTPKTWLNRLF